MNIAGASPASPTNKAMAFGPAIISREPQDITVEGATFPVWSAIGVDYGNAGSDVDPPTLVNVNEVDESVTNSTTGSKNVIALPLSAEGVEILKGVGAAMPQYRYHITVRAHRRWPPS